MLRSFCCAAALILIPATAAFPPTSFAEQPSVETLSRDEQPSTLEKQAKEYQEEKPKTVIQLQQFRQTQAIELRGNSGLTGTAKLINLNPSINSWFVLELQLEGRPNKEILHLENPKRLSQQITLDPAYPDGIVLVNSGQRYQCSLWADWPNAPLNKVHKLGKPYVSLCQDRLYLLNRNQGYYTNQEWVASLLRDHVWQGESMIGFVKSSLFKDAFLDSSSVVTAEASEMIGRPISNNIPQSAQVDPAFAGQFLASSELGISIDNPNGSKLAVGQWYRAHELPNVFLSSIQPGLVSAELKRDIKGEIQPLDAVESRANAYLVAFSLNGLEPGFAVGSENPGVEWSERALESVQNKSLPGPDGIGNIAPLAPSGLLSPADGQRVVATFTGGFKRHHGAFRYGDLAKANHGSHYGFIENGVVLSKLEPGLATFVVYNDGRVELRTWRQEDNGDLNRVRFARQNGVPIIDYDDNSGSSMPGQYVRQWGLGNWSGSEDSSQRTLRAGLCLQERDQNRYLIYGYFSSVTPSAMAQVFQAYHCKYAMHLDMNALEHTYLALYRRVDGQIKVEHLVKGMEVVDKEVDGQRIPRFIGYADNRDFFYLLDRDITQ